MEDETDYKNYCPQNAKEKCSNEATSTYSLRVMPFWKSLEYSSY